MTGLLKRIAISVLVMIILFLSHGCSPEKKLAKSFVNDPDQKSILLLGPELVFKKSLKTSILDSLKITDETLFDSVLMANSDFLQYINDSLFLQNYLKGYEEECKLFHVDVYRESQTADFLEVDSNAWVIYLAQVELEESWFPYRDETRYLDSYYYHDHILNAATVYSWFEVNQVDKKGKRNVYFIEDAIIDEVEGEFALDYFGGQVKYYYRIDSLKTEDLYGFAFNLGRKYAGYTYDLLLNDYIRENMEVAPRYYLRFDPFYKSFFEATDDRFILLEGK